MPTDHFHCPGDNQQIAPSVHFARLRAGFFACKTCPQRQEQGMLELVPLANGFNSNLSSVNDSKISSSVSTNRTLRTDQTEYFEALIHHIAEWFWSQQAFVPTKEDFLSRNVISRPQAPTLVVGYDGDLKTADRLNWAIERLNLLGLKIVDTGKTPLACLEYLKINLEADGYLSLQQFAAPHHTLTIECLAKSGKTPWESGELPESTKPKIKPRELRNSGNWRTHSGLSSYEASFIRRLFGLRPLKICFYLTSTYQQVLLQQISEEWPCKSIIVPNVSSNGTLDRQMAIHIRKEHADFGCHISSDGKHLTIWDETGCQLSHTQVNQLLANYLLKEYPDDFISIHQKHTELLRWLDIFQDRISQHAHQSEVFSNSKCRLLINNGHEVWHKDPELRRDGFLSLIYIIKKLSEKDTKLSELTRSYREIKAAS